MRIVAGEFGSRRIEAPAGMSTRPTLDKVREAVFSALGGRFEGGRVLDIYAGSGANGFEALSRGMDTAVFIDNDRKACAVIRRNADTLKVKERTRILSMSDVKALKLLQEEGIQFDLIYMDPPYAKQKNRLILEMISEYDLLSDGGTVVIESAKEDSFAEDCGNLCFEKDRIYGITRITYCRKMKEKKDESMLSGNI